MSRETLIPPDMPSRLEVIHANGKEYRAPRENIVCGLVCTPFFGLVGLASVCIALWNPDGSFSYPIASAIFLGTGWFSFCGASCWMVWRDLYHRLFVNRQLLRLTNRLHTRELLLAQVQHAEWKCTSLLGGTLVLHTGGDRATIDFGRYTREGALELKLFFRGALDPSIQEGWELFEPRWMPRQQTYQGLQQEMQKLKHFAIAAWVTATTVYSLILIGLKMAYGVPEKLWAYIVVPHVVAALLTGICWMLIRNDLANAKRRELEGDGQAEPPSPPEPSSPPGDQA